jgi:hypothetical protein
VTGFLSKKSEIVVYVCSFQQAEAASHRDNFSLFNVTLFELRSVTDRISTGLDVETVRAKTTESQVSSLRAMMENMEADRALWAATDNVRVERVEQRLDDLVSPNFIIDSLTG